MKSDENTEERLELRMYYDEAREKGKWLHFCMIFFGMQIVDLLLSLLLVKILRIFNE